MADATILEMPAAHRARASERSMVAAREAYIAEYIAWLRHAHPSRDDAEMEAEIAAGTLRQLAIANTRGG